MSMRSLFSSKKINRFISGIILEFGPIFIFLFSFHHFHIYKATFILMITTIISTVITYTRDKRLPYVALYVAFLTTVFGYMTIEYHQPRFIQMRDTLYDATSALTLILGMMINVPFLKLAFNDILAMTDRAWTKMTYAWVFFFIVNAILNEYVRRTYTLSGWFNFKIGIACIASIFTFSMLYFLYESPQNTKDKNSV